MPQTLAQVMGMLVTALIVFGTDLDVLYAVPLGIFAGALTIYLAALAPQRRTVKTAPAPVKRRPDGRPVFGKGSNAERRGN